MMLPDVKINQSNPWSGVLSATMFATQATLHTTLRATLATRIKLRSDFEYQTQGKQEIFYFTNESRELQ